MILPQVSGQKFSMMETCTHRTPSRINRHLHCFFDSSKRARPLKNSCNISKGGPTWESWFLQPGSCFNIMLSRWLVVKWSPIIVRSAYGSKVHQINHSMELHSKEEVICRLKGRRVCKYLKGNVFLTVPSVFMTNVFQGNLSSLLFWKSFPFEWLLTFQRVFIPLTLFLPPAVNARSLFHFKVMRHLDASSAVHSMASRTLRLP